jgi:hypothetical protein
MLSVVEITFIAMLLYMLITSIILVSNLNNEDLSSDDTMDKN